MNIFIQSATNQTKTTNNTISHESTFKVGDIVTFIPGKFLNTVSYIYPDTTDTELYKIINLRQATAMIDISPLKNPHIRITGIYSDRFQKHIFRVSKTKSL